MDKHCRTCDRTKSLTEFNRKGSGHQSRCRSCQKAYIDTHYQNNRDWYLKRNRSRADRWREIIRARKARPCADCGVEYPYYVMQFDHTADDKSFTIGNIGWVRSEKALLAEISKCEVVCANCHAVRTWMRAHDGR